MKNITVKGALHLSFTSDNLQNKFLNEISILQDLLKQRLNEEKDEQTKYEINEILKVSKPKKVTNFINIDSEEFRLTPHELHFIKKANKSIWVDFLIHRYRFKKYPLKKKVTPFPVHVLIEPTSVCNLRCIMCFQIDKSFSHNKNFMGFMGMDLYNKLIEEISENNCQSVTLASRGEPTLHKEFDLMLDKLSQKKIYDTKINTNATVLTDKLIHSILSNNIAVVTFSADACNKETYERIRVKGKFEKVVNNIKRFKEIRDSDYPNHITQTRISGVAVENTQSPKEMESFWKKYVDQVSIKREIPRWDSYGNPIHNKESVCTWLYERLYIWFDGMCVPCDFDYKSYLNLGNANKNTIKEIWHGKKYDNIRERHIKGERKCVEPCNRCLLGIN